MNSLFILAPDEPAESEVYVRLESLMNDPRAKDSIARELELAMPIIDRALQLSLYLGISSEVFQQLVIEMIRNSGGSWQKDSERKSNRMDVA